MANNPERGLGTSGFTLTPEQQMNAGAIIATGMEMGLDDQTITAALATAFMESGLRNVDYGDRDSLGLFQQRPSQGWGTPEQVRDPKHASRKFFEAYLKAKGSTVVERIANTQRPAAEHRGKYANWFDEAESAFRLVAGFDAPKLAQAAPDPKVGEPRVFGGAGATAAAGAAPPEGGGGTVTVSTSSAPTEIRPDITADSSPEEVEEYINTYYADVAPFLGDPAIKMLLYAAAINDWDERKLDAAIEQTTYWKTHGPQSRALDALLAEDKKGAEQVIDNAKGIVSDLFSQNGLNFDDAKIGDLAKQALRNGTIGFNQQGQVFVSDQDNLNEMLAFGLGSEGPMQAGTASLTADSLGVLARQYFVPVTRSSLEDWTRRIISGAASEETFTSWLHGQARTAFRNDPEVLSSLDAGTSPAEHFQAHRAAIAETLELDESAVDLMDRRYRDILSYRDPADPKAQPRSMTWVEAERWARQQTEFKDTRQYQKGAADKATLLRSFFGEAA